jgi:hypothetical protein
VNEPQSRCLFVSCLAALLFSYVKYTNKGADVFNECFLSIRSSSELSESVVDLRISKKRGIFCSAE